MIEFNRAFWLAFSTFILMAFFSVKLAFLFLGMYFLVTALFLKYRYSRLKNWKQVDGTLLEKRIEQKGIGARNEPLYIAYIKYAYILGQKKNYSTVLSLFKNDFFTADKRTLEQTVKKIRRGRPVTVYVDPSRSRSVLFIEMLPNAIFYFIFNLLLGSTLVIISIMMKCNEGPIF